MFFEYDFEMIVHLFFLLKILFILIFNLIVMHQDTKTNSVFVKAS